jgi:hypothetical protein
MTSNCISMKFELRNKTVIDMEEDFKLILYIESNFKILRPEICKKCKLYNCTEGFK